MKENKAYWKSRALFYEQQFKAAQERNQLLIDQNKLLAEQDKERQIEFAAKRTFMEKVEKAWREYQIAFASGDCAADECESDWHGQIGGTSDEGLQKLRGKRRSCEDAH